MGRIIAKKVRGMNWMAKISLILIFTMVFSTFMYQGWYSPKPASAAITTVTGNAWSQIYSNQAATRPTTLAYPVNTGSNTSRLLVVAVSTETNAAGSETLSITYGTRPMTQVRADGGTTQAHSYLFYLNESNLDQATNQNLVFTFGGATAALTAVYATVFDGVDQTTPITGNSGNTGTTSVALTTPIVPVSNEVTVEVVSMGRSTSGTARTITTPATNWTITVTGTALTDGTRMLNPYILTDTTAGSTTANHTISSATASTYSMSAMRINPLTCTDPDPATLTTTAPASSSTVSGAVTVQTQVGVEAAPSGLTGMVVNITGSTGCNVTNGAMTWNAGTSRWEYSWNTAACGTATPDTGVSITVSGTDPDCGTAVSAAAVTNVTIDNTKLPSTITSCAGCHPYSPTFADGTARNTPAGQFQGSHNPHVQDTSITCSVCHVAPATETAADFAHRNGNIQMQASIRGGTYSRGASFAQANTFTPGTCSTTNCHGTNSGTWGTNTTNDVCTKCHGVPTAAPAAAYKAAPGADGTGVDTAGQSVATDAQVGAHNAHLLASINISSPVACNECHTVPATVTAAGHNDTALPAELTWGTLATSGGKTPSYTSPNCTSVYCHTANRPAGTGAGQGGLSTVTAWTNTALLGNTSVTDTCINKCHEMPPRGGVAGDSHGGLTAPGTYTTPASLAACSSNSPGTGCHPTVSGAPTSMATIFVNTALHIDGAVQGGDCVSCHEAAVSSPTASGLSGGAVTQRRAIVPEFAAASSHKRSAVPAGTVTNADCGVCHMEGNASDGSINATYHRDGYIDLRDPDTGNPIQDATWTNTPAGAGSYASSGTALNLNATAANRLVRFSRDLASNVLEIQARSIMINQCLKCHDANGALSTTARVLGGTAEKPFATTISGAGYTGTGVTANGVTGGVTDIAAAFATSNSSYHPILGKQNNSYTQGTRMVAPWNMTKTNANTTSWGYLMTCFDCHANNAATGVQTRTVTAHGSAITAVTNSLNALEMRGAFYRSGTVSATNNTTFCIACHAGYNTSTASNHGTGSALASSTNNGMTNYLLYACYYCHSSNSAKPARPVPGIDVHGFNRLPGTGTDARWPNGATETSRPYAFIRVNNVTPSFLTNHRPLTAVGELTSGSATCASAGTTNPCSDGMGTYTPGGVY